MNKFIKKIMSKKDGFTLVELIVVIAILAILAGVAVPAYSGYIKNANEAADITTLSAVKTAVMAHYATEVEVDQIIVTDDTTDTVQVWLTSDVGEAGAFVATGRNPVDADSDFMTYMNATTTFNITLETGDVATWTAASGEWAITTANNNG